MVARYFRHRFNAVFASLVLAGCGGGSSESSSVGVPTDAQRAAAAKETADTNANCREAVLGPYYWEIGDRNGVKASGTVGSGAPSATKMMSIASASKWVYSAYVVQKVGVRTADVPFLNFTSGYTVFTIPLCQTTDTVQSCLAGNDVRDPDTIGKFGYSSGHMQHHAVNAMGLGPMDNAALSAEVNATIGSSALFYSQPQLAGGVVASAADYAQFLRRILRGELAIGAALGTDKVCTNPATCPTAVGSPIPESESWNYSLGHWVEDDPRFGDHAFSSAGALGFYPWIDRTKTIYGILARKSSDFEPNAGFHSAQCGRLIRQAWVTGTAVSASTPTP